MPDIFGRETPQERMERERLEAAQKEAEARKEEAKARGVITKEAAKRASLPGTLHGSMHGGAANYAQGVMNRNAAHLDQQNKMIGQTLRANARRVADGKDRMLEKYRTDVELEKERMKYDYLLKRLREEQEMEREKMAGMGHLRKVKVNRGNGWQTEYR